MNTIFTSEMIINLIESTDLNRYYIEISLNTMQSGGLASSRNGSILITNGTSPFTPSNTYLATIDQYHENYFVHSKYSERKDNGRTKQDSEISRIPYNLISIIKVIQYKFY